MVKQTYMYEQGNLDLISLDLTDRLNSVNQHFCNYCITKYLWKISEKLRKPIFAFIPGQNLGKVFTLETQDSKSVSVNSTKILPHCNYISRVYKSQFCL